MSRIGTKPVPVPGNVKVAVDAGSNTIKVEGPKGKLEFMHHADVSVNYAESDNQVVCSIPEDRRDSGRDKALWGTTRARIACMVQGVVDGYERLGPEGLQHSEELRDGLPEAGVLSCHMASS